MCGAHPFSASTVTFLGETCLPEPTYGERRAFGPCGHAALRRATTAASFGAQDRAYPFACATRVARPTARGGSLDHDRLSDPLPRDDPERPRPPPPQRGSPPA